MGRGSKTNIGFYFARNHSLMVFHIGQVYLDEPTTGMDPINRRHVWDVVSCRLMIALRYFNAQLIHDFISG